MKFLHTADWQFGMKAVHVGRAAQRVRAERLAAAQRVIDAARAHQVDFLLVAGDTFEDNGVDRVLVRQTGDLLATAGCPVFILPGNHDPLMPGSVWQHSVWNSHEQLHVIAERKPIPVPRGVLYPSPLFEKYSQADPTLWINAHVESSIAIGLAHGTLQGVGADVPDYPIANNAATRAGLDYLALGHWHSYLPQPDPNGAIRLAYSGTHETTKFGERDSGNALIVEIVNRGDAPRITPVHVGGLTWTQTTRALNSPGDLARLRTEFEKQPHGATTLLELRLEGVLSPAEEAELTALEEILSSRYLFARVKADSLVPAPHDDAWLESLPSGVLQQTAIRLRELTRGPNAPVASRALLDLYRYWRESQ